MQDKGLLFILSAPSGTGKTTLVNALIQEMPNICVSISHTTRLPRKGEQEAKDYYFVNQTEFKTMRDQDVFLEYAEVFGNFYGTSQLWVKETLKKGKDVILEIDWQGARQIRKRFTNAISIFILPPSQETLRMRLETRHTDNKDTIEQRLQQAIHEMAHYTEYDYIICNNQFEKALEDLKAVVRSKQLHIYHLREDYKKLIEAPRGK